MARPSDRHGSAYRTRVFLRDVLAWTLLLILATATAIGWHRWAHHRVLGAPSFEAGVKDARLAVLAYDRVVATPDGRHVDAERLRQQLEALRAAGFEPVTLSAVARFYQGRGTLPRRAVLLTFDHGYLSTVSAVDPVLRRLKWPAVMFVMTERQERRDPFFLYWPRLQRMVASGIWEVGSHGHLGHEPIVVDGAGSQGPFFIRRAWRAGQGREETWAEFAARLEADHRQAREILQRQLGRLVLAYAPPLRDVAVASLDPEVKVAYERTVDDHYAVAFVDDLFGVNDGAADRHRLQRRRVSLRLSAEELAQLLVHAIDDSPAPPYRPEPFAGVWVSAAGAAQRRGDEIVVTGPTRADLWRSGSEWMDDWVLEADVEVDGGQFWVLQQSPDLSEEWRWGGNERRTHLQRRRPAHNVETLVSFPARVQAGRRHHLKVVRRGAGLWVEWDGEPVAERPAFLPERWRGHVGLGAWGEDGPARLRVTNLRLEEIPYRVWPLDPWPGTDDVQAVAREAPSVAALSPLWLEAGGGALEEQPLDRDLLAILARRYGWEIVPTVRMSPGSDQGLEAWLPGAMRRAQKEGWAGLRLDVGALPDAARDRLAAIAHARRAARPQAPRLLVETTPSPPPTAAVADGVVTPALHEERR